MQITEEEYHKLRAESIMLGQIAAYVEDFCKDEHDTTLMAVLSLLSEYYYLKSEDTIQALERIKNIHSS
jgi:hypothetical protein